MALSRQQQQLTVLTLLICVMVAVYAKMLRRPAQRSVPLPTPETSSRPVESQPAAAARPDGASGGISRLSSVAGSASKVIEQRKNQRQQALQLAWGRDPFTHGFLNEGASELNLSGILWDAAEPMAIINGETLHVGDELEGYRITAIGHDRVSVSDGSQTFELLIAP